MAESKELKSLLMKVEEENGTAGLKLNIQKMKIMSSVPIISWHIDGEPMETVTEFMNNTNLKTHQVSNLALVAS